MAHVSGGEGDDTRREQGSVLSFLIGVAVALDLPEGVRAEHLLRRPNEPWLAHDRNQSLPVFAQIVPADAAVGLFVGGVPLREQSGEVAIALSILHQ